MALCLISTLTPKLYTDHNIRQLTDAEFVKLGRVGDCVRRFVLYNERIACAIASRRS